MARISYQSVPEGQGEQYLKALCSGDRFTFSKVRRNDTLLSKKRVKGLSARSLFPQCSEAWALLSDPQKLEWKNAGAEMGLSSWQLFVQDKIIRIKNSMIGNATPSLLHQSWVGQLKITAPASELKIGQFHPRFYWISKPVKGKKGMREPVLVDEDFALPLKIGLNYKSELVSAGADPFAKMYATIWYSYQGVNLFQNLEIDLDLVADWKSAENTLSSITGTLIGYNLFIHLHDLTGNLYIDNIIAEHSAQNWARDPYCKDIEQGFTKAFYQVPKHWIAITLPVGSEFDSIYKDF